MYQGTTLVCRPQLKRRDAEGDVDGNQPSSESGCSAIVRPEPPIRTLAPTRHQAISPEAPTYSPANAPAGIPTVGANTARRIRRLR